MHLPLYIAICISISLTSSTWVPEMENVGLYQGDMELTPDQLQEVKKGTFGFGSIIDRRKLWINDRGEAVVPYVIESSLLSENVAVREIKAAFSEYHRYTCIRLVERTDQKQYISFHKGKGCTSPVGKRSGGINRVSLGKGCWWRSIVVHEIAHSLGLHHEQSRPDRDKHVEILFNHVKNGTEFNFKKARPTEVNSLGTPYDYLSVMHYGWNAFGKDQKTMTIKTKDPKYQYLIGQDEGLSRIDVEQLHLLYRCSGKYPKIPDFVFPPPGCHDLGPGCSKSRHYGQCRDFRMKIFLSETCRYTCGYCGNKVPRPTVGGNIAPTTRPPSKTTNPTGECSDRVTDCQHIGKHRCNDTRKSWRQYMEKSCRRFCNFC